MSDLDRLLKASEAAWLARVNDDTVRKWFGHPDLPLVGDARVRWGDLDEWCARHRKPRLLPASLLHASAEQIHIDVQSAGSETASVDVPIHDQSSALNQTRLALQQSERREAALRVALREKLAGSTHARSDAAASDRALRELLDTMEAAAESGAQSQASSD